MTYGFDLAKLQCSKEQLPCADINIRIYIIMSHGSNWENAASAKKYVVMWRNKTAATTVDAKKHVKIPLSTAAWMKPTLA